MTSTKKTLSRMDLYIYLFCGLFFIKTLILAFAITPLWSIPDEIGHVAYVKEIATQYKIPVLGKAKIDSQIFTSLKGGKTNFSGLNWIAQHSPIYYFFAASFYKIGSFFTSDPEVLFRMPRIASVLFSTLALFFLFKTIRILEVDTLTSICILSFVAFLPMYSNISSGTNNDAGVIFFSILSVYYWVKFMQQKNIKSAYLSMFWLSVAATTKMTVIVFIPPMLAILLWELKPKLSRQWCKHAVLLSMTSMSILGIWLLRNYLIFNTVFPTTDIIHMRPDKPIHDSLLNFLSKKPFYENFLITFYGFFGHVVKSQSHFIVIRSIPLYIYYLISVTTVTFAFIFFMTNFMRMYCSDMNKEKFYFLNKKVFVTSFFLIIGISLYFSTTYLFIPHGPFGHLRRILFIEIATFSTLIVTSFPFWNGKKERIYNYSLMVFIFFVAVITLRLYHIYLLKGHMLANQGRYFFPLFSFIVIAFIIPAMKFIKPTRLIMLVFVLLLIFTESLTFITQAIPWYLE